MTPSGVSVLSDELSLQTQSTLASSKEVLVEIATTSDLLVSGDDRLNAFDKQKALNYLALNNCKSEDFTIVPSKPDSRLRTTEPELADTAVVELEPAATLTAGVINLKQASRGSPSLEVASPAQLSTYTTNHTSTANKLDISSLAELEKKSRLAVFDALQAHEELIASYEDDEGEAYTITNRAEERVEVSRPNGDIRGVDSPLLRCVK